MRIFFLLIAFVPLASFAQADSSGVNEPIIDFAAEIFNGKEHQGYMPSIVGTAYYMENDWQPGSILYRDLYYPHVWMKFDVVQKELIVQHPTNKLAITLFTPRISSFSISGKNFISVGEKDTFCLKPGIYEEVAKGNFNFYILRSKYLLETPTPYGMERQFLTNDSYYAVKDHKCYSLKKKKDIWNLVNEKKSAIKSDLRKKGLSYKRDKEASLTEIITFYNDAAN